MCEMCAFLEQNSVSFLPFCITRLFPDFLELLCVQQTLLGHQVQKSELYATATAQPRSQIFDFVFF